LLYADKKSCLPSRHPIIEIDHECRFSSPLLPSDSSKHSPNRFKSESSNLRTLTANPRPQGVKKLAGEDNLHRIREGDYRIIYTIRDKELIVLVVKIGDRKEIYC
jgi:mRNA-degrading endonuclease RelE of RelBE toxin-antitoxin system